jgi:hypothetical protein
VQDRGDRLVQGPIIQRGTTGTMYWTYLWGRVRGRTLELTQLRDRRGRLTSPVAERFRFIRLAPPS